MKRALTLVAGAALALTLAACGSSSDTATSSTSAAAAGSSAAMTSEAMTSDAMTSEAMTSDAMGSDAMESGAMEPATLVGAGCADYAAAVPSGAGSVEGMSLDPVATAASNNPLLTTLTAAVSGEVNPDVNLVNTLNNGEFTVFAPVDSAFAEIPAATMDTLKTDAPLLSGILTYHVVPGQLSPTEVVGEHPTANGATLVVTGSGDNLEVDGAKVICGGVKTKNATVYLIDTVLMPPAA